MQPLLTGLSDDEDPVQLVDVLYVVHVEPPLCAVHGQAPQPRVSVGFVA